MPIPGQSAPQNQTESFLVPYSACPVKTRFPAILLMDAETVPSCSGREVVRGFTAAGTYPECFRKLLRALQTAQDRFLPELHKQTVFVRRGDVGKKIEYSADPSVFLFDLPDGQVLFQRTGKGKRKISQNSPFFSLYPDNGERISLCKLIIRRQDIFKSAQEITLCQLDTRDCGSRSHDLPECADSCENRAEQQAEKGAEIQRKRKKERFAVGFLNAFRHFGFVLLFGY